jgi:hypothetical protein
MVLMKIIRKHFPTVIGGYLKRKDISSLSVRSFPWITDTSITRVMDSLVFRLISNGLTKSQTLREIQVLEEFQ